MKEGDFPSPFRFASSFDNANIVKKSDIQIFIGKILTHGAPLRDETGNLPGRQVPRMPPRGTEAHSSRLRVS